MARNSMAMNARPSSSPMSWIVQMLGWFKAEAACASPILHQEASRGLCQGNEQ